MATHCTQNSNHDWKKLFSDLPTEEDFELAGAKGSPLHSWLEERKAEYDKDMLSKFYLCSRCEAIGVSQPNASIEHKTDQATISKYQQKAAQWNEVSVSDKFREIYGTSDKVRIKEILTKDKRRLERVADIFSTLIEEIEEQIKILSGIAASQCHEQKWDNVQTSIDDAKKGQAVLEKLDEAQTEWRKITS